MLVRLMRGPILGVRALGIAILIKGSWFIVAKTQLPGRLLLN